MLEASRKQYLKAMGVDVWVRRVLSSEELALMSQSATTELQPQLVIKSDSELEGAREILKQNPLELTQWLNAQCLMPVRVGDVKVTTIGSQDARLLVLSECSVLDKVTHQPFSGKAAFLLQAMLKAIGESFESVLQAELDTPHHDAKTLVSLLQKQSIKAVLLLVDLPPGEDAAVLSRFREQTYTHDDVGTRVFVSYHPDYLIAHPEVKALAWTDLKKVRDYVASE